MATATPLELVGPNVVQSLPASSMLLLGFETS
jgi:hypothetical protein